MAWFLIKWPTWRACPLLFSFEGLRTNHAAPDMCPGLSRPAVKPSINFARWIPWIISTHFPLKLAHPPFIPFTKRQLWQSEDAQRTNLRWFISDIPRRDVYCLSSHSPSQITFPTKPWQNSRSPITHKDFETSKCL